MTTHKAAPPVVSATAEVPRRVAMAGLASAMFLVTLDTAMVNLAASAIREDLGLSAAELTVVVNSYLVAFAGLLLLGGRLADVLEGRRVFLLGMTAYLATSMMCALATSGPMLIGARVGQGISAAVVVPSALALVLALYRSPSERTRAMGIWGIMAGAGSLLGVFLGGVLTDALGWASVFWSTVPIGILGGIVVWRAVPLLPGQPSRFDLPGAITITMGISALAFGMISASEAGWGAPVTLLGLGVGVASLLAFVLVEHRSSAPLVPLGVFRRRSVVTANLVVLMVGATLVSTFFFLPLYQQGELGMSALEAGMSQIPIAVMTIVGSGAAPMLAHRLGVSRALSVGLVVLVLGVMWLVLDPTTSGFSVHLLGSFLLIGAGLGLGLVNAIALGVRESEEGESGLLSGLISAAQQLGGAVGLAALAGIAIGSAGSDGDVNFTAAFLGQATLILIALALSFIPASGKTPPAPAVPGVRRPDSPPPSRLPDHIGEHSISKKVR